MSIQESWWIDLAPDNHAHCLQVIYASRSDINKSHDDHHQNWRFNKVAIKILPTSMKRCIMLGGFCLTVSLMMWITVGQYVEYVENSVWNWQSQFSVFGLVRTFILQKKKEVTKSVLDLHFSNLLNVLLHISGAWKWKFGPRLFLLISKTAIRVVITAQQ